MPIGKIQFANLGNLIFLFRFLILFIKGVRGVKTLSRYSSCALRCVKDRDICLFSLLQMYVLLSKYLVAVSFIRI